MAYQPDPPAKIKPGGAWYAIGIILIVIGVIGAIVIWVVGFKNLSDSVDNFARYEAPGARDLTFKSDGTFTIYYEGSDDRSDVPDLDITFTDSGGNELPVERGDIPDISFSVNDHAGVAVAKVRIPEAGTYTIDVQSSDPGPFDVAVGRGVIAKLGVFILIGIAVGFVGVVLGVITLIVTGVKRGRRKREAAAALAPAATSSWGAAPAAPPGGWNAPPTAPPLTPPPFSTPPPPPPPSGGSSPPPPPPPSGTSSPHPPPPPPPN